MSSSSLEDTSALACRRTRTGCPRSSAHLRDGTTRNLRRPPGRSRECTPTAGTLSSSPETPVPGVCPEAWRGIGSQMSGEAEGHQRLSSVRKPPAGFGEGGEHRAPYALGCPRIKCLQLDLSIFLGFSSLLRLIAHESYSISLIMDLNSSSVKSLFFSSDSNLTFSSI